MLVNGFSGLGVHTVLSVQTLFPHQYKSYVFVSVGVIDSAIFKGQAEVEALKRHTIEDLEKYVEFAHRLGFKAEYRFEIGTEAVQSVVEVCEQVRKEFPRSIFYLGQLVFENDRVYYQHPAQRDGVRDPAPAAVRRTPGRRAPDPRARASEEAAARGRYSGRSARVMRRSTASRAGTPS